MISRGASVGVAPGSVTMMVAIKDQLRMQSFMPSRRMWHQR
jgi:hypothetical protein